MTFQCFSERLLPIISLILLQCNFNFILSIQSRTNPSMYCVSSAVDIFAMFDFHRYESQMVGHRSMNENNSHHLNYFQVTKIIAINNIIRRILFYVVFPYLLYLGIKSFSPRLSQSGPFASVC